MPAMRLRREADDEEPLSPRLLRGQREFEAIQRAWSHSGRSGTRRSTRSRSSPPAREAGPAAPTGRVAAFFSGGVDSWATVLDNPDLTDLIFVRGFDIMPRLEHQGDLADRVERQLREAAAELGLTLHVVETNLRELSDPLLRWEHASAAATVAVALFFEPLFDRVLIAGDADYEVQPKVGANWLVDQLWSTERLEIVESGSCRTASRAHSPDRRRPAGPGVPASLLAQPRRRLQLRPLPQVPDDDDHA